MKKEKFFLAILLLACIDQIIKLIVILNKSVFPITVINNVLDIVYCENRGMAFGMGTGATALISLITAIIMILILVLVYKNYAKMTKKLIWGVALLVSGGLGNFLDRICRSYVVDFIYFKPIDFPVFNFADICVVIGVCLIALGFILLDRGENVEKN